MEASRTTNEIVAHNGVGHVADANRSHHLRDHRLDHPRTHLGVQLLLGRALGPNGKRPAQIGHVPMEGREEGDVISMSVTQSMNKWTG